MSWGSAPQEPVLLRGGCRRVGVLRVSLCERCWAIHHIEPSGVRRKVPGPAVPLGPSGRRTASRPDHTAPPALGPVLPGGHAPRAGPQRPEALALGHQLSEDLPGWPQTPCFPLRPRAQPRRVEGPSWGRGAAWGTFVSPSGLVVLTVVGVGGCVFLRQCFPEPRFLRSENQAPLLKP